MGKVVFAVMFFWTLGCKELVVNGHSSLGGLFKNYFISFSIKQNTFSGKKIKINTFSFFLLSTKEGLAAAAENP